MTRCSDSTVAGGKQTPAERSAEQVVKHAATTGSAALRVGGELQVWRPRVTVACVIERAGSYLLVEEDIHGQHLINQPAGHLEPGESLLDAAVRETREETGWTVCLTGLIGIYQWVSPNSREQYVRFAFTAIAEAHDATLALDAGIIRALWLHPEEIDGVNHRPRSPMVLRNIQDSQRRAPLPLDALHAYPLAGSV